jgi:hypothetical protein
MFRQIILRLFPAERPLLGRWCLNDKTKNSWKIDMANIDNCGTCTFTKKNTSSEKNSTTKNHKNNS